MLTGAGSSPAGAEPCGEYVLPAPVAARDVTAPASLYFDGATKTFPLDANGRYRSLHPVDQAVALALLEQLGEPLLTSTLLLPGDEFPLTEGWEIQDRLDDHLELILDGGYCGTEPTTVVDLTAALPVLVRAGRGPLAPFGLD